MMADMQHLTLPYIPPLYDISHVRHQISKKIKQLDYGERFTKSTLYDKVKI